MGHRRWFKIHSERWLRGSMRDISPQVRGIWVDVLALASDGYYGEEGIIKFADGESLSDKQIARLFNIPLEQWLEAKETFISNRMLKNSLGKGLEVVNWKKYQSEYERQKPYRQKLPDDPDKYQGFNRTEYIRQYMKDYRVKQNVKLTDVELTVNSVSEEEEEEDISTISSTSEKTILNIFKSITNYPFNYRQDLNYIRQLAIDFPQADLLAKAKKWATSKLDKPLKTKSNPHLQFRNWVEDKQGYDQKGEQSGTHKQRPRALKPREAYRSPEQHRTDA